MKLNVINNKKIKLFEQTLNELCNYALTVLEIKETKLEVNLEFVSSLKIKNINKKFRGINKKTDVLSFPNLPLNEIEIDKLNSIINKENFKNDVLPESENIFLGDIIICFKQVKKQSKEFETGIERELGYLVIHGLLHLLGFDHENEEDKLLMRKYEEIILEHFNLKR